MKIDHAAMYVKNLEAAKAFFETYFGAAANAKYRNPSTGLETYFLTFDCGARLEIMRRPGLESAAQGPRQGYAHLALQVGGREGVDSLTARLKADGYTILSGPRETGDGYYESCVLDAEGNSIEIVG